MYGVLPIELIVLPNEVREGIVSSFEKANIEVALSERKLPRNLRNKGTCYRCTEGDAHADILVLSEDSLGEAGIDQLAVFLLPRQGFFHELKFGSLNKRLRDRVRSALHSLKEEVPD